MAKGKIGALIALDGEKEFKQAVTDCNKSLATLKSEMALVQAESEGQANSLDALQKKHTVLTKVLEEQENKQQAVSDGLEHAKQSYEKIGDDLENLKGKLSDATEALEGMRKSSDATDEELKQQEKTVKELSDAVAKGENNYKTAGDRVQDWEAKLNTAKAQVVKTNNELDKNASYMREAEQATDKCATSIDEFGKKTKQVARDLDEASDKSTTFGSVLKANLTSDAIVGGIKALAGAAKEGAEQMVSLATEAAAYADNILTASTVTRMSTDDLQAYSYAAELVDVSTDTLTKSMAKNVKSMSNARDGSEKYAEAYKKLGVKIEDTDGNLRNSEDVYWAVIDALKEMSDETERDSVSMQLFGKSAQELNPLIMQGSEGIAALKDEAKAMGAVLDGETLTSLGKTDDTLQRLYQTTDIFKRTVGAAVAPVVQSVAQAAIDTINNITNALNPQKSALESFVDEIEASNQEVNTLLNNSKTTMSNAEADAAKFDTYKDSLIELNGVTEKTEYQKFQMKTIVGELASSVPELAAAFDEETSSINLTDQEIRNLMESHKQYALQEASIKAQTDAMTALFDAELNAAKAASAVKEAQKQIGDIESQDNFEELLGMNDDLLNQYRDANGVLKDAKDAEEEATEAVKEAQEQYSYTSEAVEAASESVAKYTGATEESTKAAQDNEEALEAQAAEEERLRQEQELRAQATAEATAQIVEDVQSQISVFSQATNLSGEELQKATQETLANMESQMTAMENWAANLQTISEMGIDKGLLKYLADMGPSGAEYVAQFATMTDDEIKKANDMWSQTMEQSEIGAKLAGKLTGETKELENKLYEEYSKATDSVINGMTDSLENGKEEVNKKSAEVADGAIDAARGPEGFDTGSPSKKMIKVGTDATVGLANGIIGKIIDVISNSRIVARSAITATSQLMTPATFYEFGLNASSGLAQGILDGQSEVINAVAAMCESATEQARKSLDINSPSKVFEELGGYSAQGYGIGFQEQMKYVQAAVNDSMRFSAAAGQGVEQSPMTSRDMTDIVENALYNGMMNAMSRIKIENNLGNLQVNVRFGTDNMAEVLQEADNQFRARNGRGMFERG